MESEATEEKSTFVTVIAWLGIVIAGFFTFISALQNLMIHLFMGEQMDEALRAGDPEAFEGMPSFAVFMFTNMELMFFLMFLLALAALIASIGLLKRKNWGRLIIIGVLGLGIAWNIGGLVFQQSFMPDMESMQEKVFQDMERQAIEAHERQTSRAGEDPCSENTDPCREEPLTFEERMERLEERKAQWQEMSQQSEKMMELFMIFAILVTVFFSAVEGWIIWKLTRPEIVKEFKPGSVAASS